MKHCTATAVSTDLPDWLKTAYSRSPRPAVSPPPRGRHRGSYSTVSEDAPVSFHNSFVSPLPPIHSTPSPAKFQYEDGSEQNSQRRDLSTVRPRHYFDLMNSRNQGLMTHLPYYQAYYQSLKEDGFGIHEGLCSTMLRSRPSTLRRDASPPLSLETVQRHSKPLLRYSPKSDLKRSFDSALFVAKAYRVRLPGLKPRRKPQREEERAQVMRELNEFDQRRKAERK